jgi:hypothetical protein
MGIPRKPNDGASPLQYLGATPPDGVAASALKGLWRFDGTADHLNDRTAGGTDLTATSGAKIGVMPGTKAKCAALLQGALYDSSPAAALAIAGALTVEFGPYSVQNPGSFYLFSFGANAGTEADNILYSLYSADAGLSTSRYASESGVGVLETKTLDFAIPLAPTFYTLTRDAAGNLNMYVNGVKVVDELASTPPTGGANGALYLGADEAETAATLAQGFLMSARIWNVEFTAAQALQGAIQAGLNE